MGRHAKLTRVTRALSVLVACALGLASAAEAQDRSRPGAGSVLDVASIDRAAGLRIRAEARALLADALHRGDIEPDPRAALAPSDVLLEQAITRYESIAELFPDDATLWVELGMARASFRRTDVDGRSLDRVDEAIEALEHARTLDPEVAEITVAETLAELRTRRRDFQGAAAEWQRLWDAREEAGPLFEEQSLALPIARRELLLYVLVGATTVSATTLLSNWAEMRMLSGDAAGAIEQYRSAVALASPRSLSAALGLWGLALAEERAGAHEDALETALRAMDADRERLRASDAAGPGVASQDFAALHAPSVFFEPPCEIHAYEALGHEALATRAATDEGRVAEWTLALRSTRYFLAEGGRASIYAEAAHDAERRLSARLAR